MEREKYGIKSRLMQKTKRNIAISKPSFTEAEWLAMKEPLDSGWLTQGPMVKAFEIEFAKRHEVKHALAVSNCTTALHLSLLAAGVGPGDEVIVPAFTWVATANAVLYCQATPVFVDIDPLSFNLDPKLLREKINPHTKAIIPVHLFGLCADMDAIRNAAGNIPLIEDAACAAGSAYKGKPAGGLGLLGCFSFHPRKSITTGEGGMITTNDDKLAEQVDILRNHGASVSEEQRHSGPRPFILPDFDCLGFNYRMTDIQGAIGKVQLAKLDVFISERNEWADFYSKQLASIPWIKTPVVSDNFKHGWQSFVLTIDETKSPMRRNEMMDHLQKCGISTRPGTHAVHMLNFYKNKFKISPEDFPNAQLANDTSMSIPLHNKMAEEDFIYVVEHLKALA